MPWSWFFRSVIAIGLVSSVPVIAGQSPDPGAPYAPFDPAAHGQHSPDNSPRSDVEPNNSFEDAADLGIINDGTVVVADGEIGYIVESSPEDYIDCFDVYRFEVTLDSGSTLPKLVTVSAMDLDSPLDLHLRLFDADGGEIARNDDRDYPDTDPELRTYLLTAGLYYVSLKRAPGGNSNPATSECPEWHWGELEPGTFGPYGLVVTVESVPPHDSPYEPNDYYSTDLGTLGDGDTVNILGEFIGDGENGRTDRDVFKFLTTESVLVVADIRVEHLGSTLDPTFNPGWGGQADNAGLATRDARLTTVKLEPGTQYVRVYGTRVGTSVDPVSVGYYDLSISVTAISDLGGPYEPNESILTATPSGLAGTGSVSLSTILGDGQFSQTRGDVDTYEVEAVEGQYLTADIDAAVIDSELDSVVVVYDYLGRVVATNDNDGQTTDSLLTVQAHQPTDDTPATLYVMILGTGQRRPPDPLNPDDNFVTDATPSTGPYTVKLTLADTPPAAPSPPIPPLAPPPPAEPGSPRFFGTMLDFPGNQIVEIGLPDGAPVNMFDAPEPLTNSGEGLAMLDDTLFYLGSGQFPRLYRLDPDTGQVLADTVLWAGSGYYGDVAALDGHLFVTDVLAGAIHELDPLAMQHLRTIDVEAINGLDVPGALATLAHPNRLFVADAFFESVIYAIDPLTGDADTSMSTGLPCPCLADFDGDGDVDAEDRTFFEDCDTNDNSVRYGCGLTDLDCDGDRDADDAAIFECQIVSSGSPRDAECCPEDLPPVPVRATALGGSGDAQLFVHDWTKDAVGIYDPTAGMYLGELPLDATLGALGGQPFFVFGDTDGDFDADLADFAMLADCIGGPESTPVVSPCTVFDAEPDGDVDLDDFAAFQLIFSHGQQP